MKEVEEEEDEGTNGFDDWERLHCNNYYRHSPPSLSSSSSHSLSPKLTAHHQHSHLSVFPPVNHEGLPLSQTTPTLSNSNSIVPPSPPPPPSSTHRNSKLVTWFDLALHLWKSKILSLITRIRIPWFLLSLRPVAAAASIMAVFWFWVRRRRKRCGGDGRIEQLKLLVKEKDEKILLLLEQIAAMNKELLTRYRIPILKST